MGDSSGTGCTTWYGTSTDGGNLWAISTSGTCDSEVGYSNQGWYVKTKFRAKSPEPAPPPPPPPKPRMPARILEL